MHRRAFLRGAATSTAVAATGALQIEASPVVSKKTPLPSRIARDHLRGDLTKRLQTEITGYMRAMNSPGMGFTLTSRAGDELSSAYGFEDLQLQTPLSPERLFQIGSISKSMATVLILQLVDEGKMDLHRPVLEYLPWLPWNTPFGAVSLHHILTHTSGMPGGGALFFAHHSWIHEQRYAPGTRYFYSNMAFNVLGHLVEMCDRRSYQESLRARLLMPLGMRSTLPELGGAGWKLQALSYIPAEPDRPFLRFGALRQAPMFHEQTSAGCVASNPAEMARYIRFLLRGGVTEDGKRLLSDASFQKMTTPWIAAKEFGKTASYGYGIAVDHQDGEKILLHTGGMVSFMSSIYLNLTQGIGSFASINAQQGYRPQPVTHFAVMALRAAKTQSRPPSGIVVNDPRVVAGAAEIAGEYEGRDGTVRITTVHTNAGTGLVLHAAGREGAMEGEGDTFLVEDAVLGAQSWTLLRDARHRVAGLASGAAFYAKSGAAPLPAPAAAPREWEAYAGRYVNDDPWVLSTVVYQRRGTLYMDMARLTPREDGSFFLEDEKDSPDRVAFAAVVQEQARIVLLNGTPRSRFRPWVQPGEDA